MKKAAALTLVGFLLVSILFISPVSLRADTDRCFDEHETCRTRALNSGAGVLKMTLILTVCDLALGTCILVNALQ